MFKTLLRYKYKSILILVSATSAIISIFLIASLSNGIVSMYSDILKSDGDIIITQKGVADTFFSEVDLALMEDISRIDGIKSVQGVIVGAGSIGEVPIAGIYGVSQNRMKNFILTSGVYPADKEVILGKNIASMLEYPKSVEVFGEEFGVVGEYKSDIGFENGGVVLSIKEAGRLFKKSSSFLLVSLENSKQNFAPLIKQINSLSRSIEAKGTNDFIDNYNQFKIIKISSSVIASISFFMGFLAIVSIMSIMISDRRYEFGILRAIGISKSVIIFKVLFEVFVLIFISFILAFVFSFFALDLLQNIDKFQGYLSGEISLELFVLLFFGSVFMALLGAFIPALIAARVDPIILINKG